MHECASQVSFPYPCVSPSSEDLGPVPGLGQSLECEGTKFARTARHVVAVLSIGLGAVLSLQILNGCAELVGLELLPCSFDNLPASIVALDGKKPSLGCIPAIATA